MHEEQLRQVLEQRPCGLLTDIDGTLSPVVPSPDMAAVPDSIREQLQILAQRLDLVAAISGRAAADAARLVDVPDLVYVGNHGLEIWHDGAAEPLPEAQPYIHTVSQLMRLAQERIKLGGVIFEDKGVSASIHYRQADDPAQAREALGEVLQELAEQHGLRLTEGRMIWEVRPPIEVNKGVAAGQLVQQHGLRGVLFLGDDRTDADAFMVLRAMRDRGECVALNIGVGGPETPDVIQQTADFLVDGVPGVEELLAQLVAHTE